MNVITWIFIALLFIILELVTTSFFLVWFGIGSLFAAILNYFGFDIYIQFIAFTIISIILILSTRMFADKITPEPNKKTTAERLIGQKARIIKKRDENNFVVKLMVKTGQHIVKIHLKLMT